MKTGRKARWLGVALAAASLAWISARSNARATDGGADRSGGAAWIGQARALAVGPTLLIVAADGRLVAQRTDRGKLAELPLPTSTWVAYDDEMELLWLRHERELDVVDLRAAKPRVERIVRQVPATTEAISIWNDRPDGRGPALAPDLCAASAMVPTDLKLRWGSRPFLDVAGRSVGDGDIVGRDWLTANLTRDLTPSPVVETFNPPSHFTVVRLPSKKACPDPIDCGRAVSLGDTKRLIVKVAQNDSVCPGGKCMLFDPETKEFSPPPPATEAWSTFAETTPGGCGRYMFDSTKKWFYVDDKLCAAGGACAEIAGRIVGWLSPGPIIGDAE